MQVPKKIKTPRPKSSLQIGLANEVRKNRMLMGITQEELAWRAKMHRSYLADIERGQMLVLNPHELLYMCDPAESSHRYGADTFTIPRVGITGARFRGEALDVAANGARVSLSMVTELGTAAAGWLA